MSNERAKYFIKRIPLVCGEQWLYHMVGTMFVGALLWNWHVPRWFLWTLAISIAYVTSTVMFSLLLTSREPAEDESVKGS